jgi:hypothetical protein
MLPKYGVERGPSNLGALCKCTAYTCVNQGLCITQVREINIRKVHTSVNIAHTRFNDLRLLFEMILSSKKQKNPKNFSR